MGEDEDVSGNKKIVAENLLATEPLGEIKAETRKKVTGNRIT